ncbi:glycine radical domain-containing pyruvate formate-lyase [Escherichia coli]|nr:glycine radical domain-containing pyruvate formate-lyase [Escherichia coli]
MLPFYQTSLTQGEDPAFLKELLESLWVKCNDIVLLRSTSSARYFAGFPTGYTALLGGLTENGRSAVNVLSFLCLDAYQSVQLPQPNLGVRTNALIDTPFLMKTAETIRLGTGIPQIFNDEVVVPAFLNRGVSLEDARDYSVVGCVELSIPGRTYGLHDIAMFNLLKVMEICLHENEGNAALTYEGLLEQIRAKISHYITLMVEGSNICDIGHRDWAPVPLLSSFISDCLEKGRDITDGGARYNFSGVQGIGIANLSDSLHALKGMIFDQQRLSFDELLSVLKANFATPEGEKVRARLINRFEKYGNDIDEVDNISAELLRHYCKEVEKYQNPRGGYFTPGSYTVSAHVPLGSVVGATPDGRFAGEQLADGGLSPMLGQDAQGPTAVLKSVSKLDNTLLSNGTLLNVKFTPATLEGEAGLRKLADFLRAFTQLKLQHIQFNVVNADTLREAQQRPQDYAGLVVRVAGYSAFFVELSKEIQDDIIRRTAHQL